MHVEIASKINKIIDDKDLTDLGKLEQDLVFGDATCKEIITYISTNQRMSTEDKVSCLYQGQTGSHDVMSPLITSHATDMILVVFFR